MKLHHKVFLVLILFLPSQLGKYFWFDWSSIFGIRVDYLAPVIYFTDILIITLCVVWFFANRHIFTINKPQKINKYLLLLFGFIGINILFSITPQISFYKWIKFLEVGFLVFYVQQNWSVLKSKMYIPLVLSVFYTFILSGLQMYFQKTIDCGFYFLGERSFTSSTPGISLTNIFGELILRPYATFSHPNSLSGYFLIVGLMLFLLSMSQKSKARVFTLIGVLISIVLVVISFSQSAWIVLVITVICLFCSKKFTGVLLRVLIPIIFITSLLLPTISKLIVQNYQFTETIQKRLELNIVTGQLITKNPLVGVGLGNFIPASVEVYKNDGGGLIKNVSWFLQPVHNIYLLILSETGIVGFVIFYLLLVRCVSKKASLYSLLLLPILLTGMTDHYWLTLQQNILLFGIVLGIISSSDTITSWTKKS